MTWVSLAVSTMNFATRLSSWMLWLHDLASADNSPVVIVRTLSKNACIGRTFLDATDFPLRLPEVQHTNMGGRSTTWLLLQTINPMSGESGNPGVESGEEDAIMYISSSLVLLKQRRNSGNHSPRRSYKSTTTFLGG